MDKLEEGNQYYQCLNKEEHVYDKEAFDEWIKISNNNNCSYCFRSIDMLEVYVNI